MDLTDRLVADIDALVDDQIDRGTDDHGQPLDDYTADRYDKCPVCKEQWHGLENSIGCPGEFADKKQIRHWKRKRKQRKKNDAASTSVTLPVHQPGDFIVVGIAQGNNPTIRLFDENYNEIHAQEGGTLEIAPSGEGGTYTIEDLQQMQHQLWDQRGRFHIEGPAGAFIESLLSADNPLECAMGFISDIIAGLTGLLGGVDLAEAMNHLGEILGVDPAALTSGDES